MHDGIVIGGSAGGYAAAIRAAQLGAGVALVEEDQLGGICVNRGCIPTKVWLKAVELLRRIRAGEAFGVKAAVEKIDFETILENKNSCSEKIRMGWRDCCRTTGSRFSRATPPLKIRLRLALTVSCILPGTSSSPAVDTHRYPTSKACRKHC